MTADPTTTLAAHRQVRNDGELTSLCTCGWESEPVATIDGKIAAHERHVLAVLAQEGWAVVRADALEEVWDDGNATGLDGWIGPGRGSGEVDNQALYCRDRVIRTVISPAPTWGG